MTALEKYVKLIQQREKHCKVLYAIFRQTVIQTEEYFQCKNGHYNRNKRWNKQRVVATSLQNMTLSIMNVNKLLANKRLGNQILKTTFIDPFNINHFLVSSVQNVWGNIR